LRSIQNVIYARRDTHRLSIALSAHCIVREEIVALDNSYHIRCVHYKEHWFKDRSLRNATRDQDKSGRFESRHSNIVFDRRDMI